MTPVSNDEIKRQINYHHYRVAIENAAVHVLVDELARRERGEQGRSLSEVAEAIRDRQVRMVILPTAGGTK